jgi:dTMP kinase
VSLFISFEGGEGSGKSTQARLLVERLQNAGVALVLVREPGTTALGSYVREWLRRKKPSGDELTHNGELFLFAAARSELVEKVIAPALKRRHTVVVADRYADSTMAYQAYGRRLAASDVQWANRLATGGTMPDLTFLLDCAPQAGLSRLGSGQISLPMGTPGTTEASRTDEEGARRFEEESLDFHQRVRSGYLELAEKEPDRWRVLDATSPIERVSDLVWEQVQERLSSLVNGDAARSATSGLPLWADQMKDPASTDDS